jgi:hypothetical protein
MLQFFCHIECDTYLSTMPTNLGLGYVDQIVNILTIIGSYAV